MPLFLRLLTLTGLLALAACGGHPGGPPPPSGGQVAQLAREIRALGPDVDPEEAQRAARIAHDYTHQLAQEYQITDGPILHNTKVNMGIKPRGLCWHWAKDIEERLKAERFDTLELHRAIANADSIRLEHSTAIISRRGDSMYDGIVLDGWRDGGVLFFARVEDDTRYDWFPRAEVMAAKLGRDRAQALLTTSND